MDSSEQALQDKMAICRAPQEFGVDTPIAPPRTGDEGGETPFREYSLHFKMALVLRGVPGGWAGISTLAYRVWPVTTLALSFRCNGLIGPLHIMALAFPASPASH